MAVFPPTCLGKFWQRQLGTPILNHHLKTFRTLVASVWQACKKQCTSLANYTTQNRMSVLHVLPCNMSKFHSHDFITSHYSLGFRVSLRIILLFQATLAVSSSTPAALWSVFIVCLPFSECACFVPSFLRSPAEAASCQLKILTSTVSHSIFFSLFRPF